MSDRRAGAAGAARGSRTAPLRQRLVVLDWMLHLFEVDSLDDLLDLLKHPDAEGIGEDGITNFHRRLVARFETGAPPARPAA